jgi:hypothetical protein
MFPATVPPGVEVDAERGAFADEGAVQPNAVVEALRRPALVHQGVAAVHGAIVEAGTYVATNGADAWLRQDLDPDLPREVDLRRELIARYPDRFDQRLGRQVATLEAVDEDLRVGSGDVHELPSKLVGIVGQRIDLFARQHGAKRHIAIRGSLLAIAIDGHGRLQAVDRQHDHLPVLAAADPHVGQRPCLEARELCGDRIAAGGKVLELHLPLRARGRRRNRRGLVGGLDTGERHRGAGQHSPRFIQHRHLQGAILGGLCRHGGRGQAGQAEEYGSAHHRSFLHFLLFACPVPRVPLFCGSSGACRSRGWDLYFTGSNFLGSTLPLRR